MVPATSSNRDPSSAAADQRRAPGRGVHDAEQVDELDRLHVLLDGVAQPVHGLLGVELGHRRHVARPGVVVDAEQTELADVAAHRRLRHREAAAVQLGDQVLLGADDATAHQRRGWRGAARVSPRCRCVRAEVALMRRSGSASAAVNALPSRAHRLVDLVAGDDQRRHEAERARADRR